MENKKKSPKRNSTQLFAFNIFSVLCLIFLVPASHHSKNLVAFVYLLVALATHSQAARACVIAGGGGQGENEVQKREGCGDQGAEQQHRVFHPHSPFQSKIHVYAK